VGVVDFFMRTLEFSNGCFQNLLSWVATPARGFLFKNEQTSCKPRRKQRAVTSNDLFIFRLVFAFCVLHFVSQVGGRSSSMSSIMYFRSFNKKERKRKERKEREKKGKRIGERNRKEKKRKEKEEKKPIRCTR
jgi:hypothetical protein